MADGIILAATWHPRGEEQRLDSVFANLGQAYSGMVFVLPQQDDPHARTMERFSKYSGMARVSIHYADDWSWGRHLALEQALHQPGAYIHYVDLDRLLRWVETRPDEWRATLALIPQQDYLVIGRTKQAYATHPQAMVETEAVSNWVVSHLVGEPMDVSAGSKGFSRAAAAYLVKQSEPGNALGMDGAWTVMLHQAGFTRRYYEVDGLDWEIADRYRNYAVDEETQHLAALAYDRDPQHWSHRVQVAFEIIKCGFLSLEAAPSGVTRDRAAPVDLNSS